MNSLKTGQFYGQTNEITHLKGLTLTDTEYTQSNVDWHYHENAYFTFILEGSVIEGNKKETYHCTAGNLLFHNCQEAHNNIKPKGFTRGFHIELEQSWFNAFQIDHDSIQGSINILNPNMRIQMYNIFKETMLDGRMGSIVIDSLLIELFSQMAGFQESFKRENPSWVYRIREILHDTRSESWTLLALAETLAIHPVHLSRNFAKYFHCNLGEYIRALKIQRSLSLLPDKSFSLTDIALECGFSDQSHFIRTFKAVNQITPSSFRKLLSK